MKILVCGGRNYRDFATIMAILYGYNRSEGSPHDLIHGDADGADRLAAIAADTLGWRVHAFPADWNRHGRSAGPLRNLRMLAEKPDLVIAFPGGRGTADMVEKARAAGVNVREIGGSQRL